MNNKVLGLIFKALIVTPSIQCTDKIKVYTDSQYVASIVQIIGQDTVDVYCDSAEECTYLSFKEISDSDIALIEGTKYRPDLRELVRGRYIGQDKITSVICLVGPQPDDVCGKLSIDSQYNVFHMTYNYDTPVVLSCRITKLLTALNTSEQIAYRERLSDFLYAFNDELAKVIKLDESKTGKTIVLNANPTYRDTVLHNLNSVELLPSVGDSSSSCQCHDHRHESFNVTYEYRSILEDELCPDVIIVEEGDEEFFDIIIKETKWEGRLIVVKSDFAAADIQTFMDQYYKTVHQVLKK